mmetsp:Transcript_63720/g.184808  ORF Transcript_63720/g.184808 Transcript_63720/m.184808 type:complete len:403 (-) Transcript_63720:57-1265(-)
MTMPTVLVLPGAPGRLDRRCRGGPRPNSATAGGAPGDVATLTVVGTPGCATHGEGFPSFGCRTSLRRRLLSSRARRKRCRRRPLLALSLLQDLAVLPLQTPDLRLQLGGQFRHGARGGVGRAIRRQQRWSNLEQPPLDGQAAHRAWNRGVATRCGFGGQARLKRLQFPPALQCSAAYPAFFRLHCLQGRFGGAGLLNQHFQVGRVPRNLVLLTAGIAVEPCGRVRVVVFPPAQGLQMAPERIDSAIHLRHVLCSSLHPLRGVGFLEAGLCELPSQRIPLGPRALSPLSGQVLGLRVLQRDPMPEASAVEDVVARSMDRRVCRLTDSQADAALADVVRDAQSLADLLEQLREEALLLHPIRAHGPLGSRGDRRDARVVEATRTLDGDHRQGCRGVPGRQSDGQ